MLLRLMEGCMMHDADVSTLRQTLIAYVLELEGTCNIAL